MIVDPRVPPAGGRILVTGSRDWTDRIRLWRALDELAPTTIVEGCARGADKLAEEWAFTRGAVLVEHHPANWARYRRAAGPRRNREMIETRPELVVYFHDDIASSRGTADMIARARRAGVPVVDGGSK